MVPQELGTGGGRGRVGRLQGEAGDQGAGRAHGGHRAEPCLLGQEPEASPLHPSSPASSLSTERVLRLPSSVLGSAVVSCADAPGDHLPYLTHTDGRESSCVYSLFLDPQGAPRRPAHPTRPRGSQGAASSGPSSTRRPALNSQQRPFPKMLDEGRRPWEGPGSAQDGVGSSPAGGQGWDPLLTGWMRGVRGPLTRAVRLLHVPGAKRMVSRLRGSTTGSRARRQCPGNVGESPGGWRVSGPHHREGVSINPAPDRRTERTWGEAQNGGAGAPGLSPDGTATPSTPLLPQKQARRGSSFLSVFLKKEQNIVYNESTWTTADVTVQPQAPEHGPHPQGPGHPVGTGSPGLASGTTLPFPRDKGVKAERSGGHVDPPTGHV